MRLLDERDHILLDFDGPVCDLYGGSLTKRDVADRLRPLIGTILPPDIARTTDPFDILRYAMSYGPATARVVEAQLMRLELEAAVNAPETPGAAAAIRGLYEVGFTITIVSNNSVDCIRSFLSSHELATAVRRISARTRPGTALKPSPFLVEQAIESLGTARRQCVLVGGSLDDLTAAKAADTAMIACTTDAATFEARGADAVIESLAELRPSYSGRPTLPALGDCRL